MRRFLSVLATLAAFAWVACSDSSGPTPMPTPNSQLHFVTQDKAAPPLLAAQVSFYAKVGQDRAVRMFYQGAAPGDPGEEFLRFEVPRDGLLRKPDGTLFQPGDSVLITVTVVDAKKFIFQFAPSGLQFSPSNPARLKIEYQHSDHDLDGDGKTDSADVRLAGLLDLWLRHPPDTLWFKQGAVKFEELEEINANIFSFTDYALAW
jgi:hypothetical protein